eukprot:4660080-Karenia_brevis.AAC.1
MMSWRGFTAPRRDDIQKQVGQCNRSINSMDIFHGLQLLSHHTCISEASSGDFQGLHALHIFNMLYYLFCENMT